MKILIRFYIYFITFNHLPGFPKRDSRSALSRAQSSSHWSTHHLINDPYEGPDLSVVGCIGRSDP